MADDVDSLLRLISRTQRLENFPRTGWLAAGIKQPESVAAHSWEVAIVALWLAERTDEPIDRGKLLTTALLHDVGEAMLTDLPKPVKMLLGDDEVARAESEAAATVLESAPDAWQEAVEAYKERSTPEARLVKAADQIQMLAKALQYDRQQRGDVARFFEGRQPADCDVEAARPVLKRLHELWESGEWFAADFD